MTPTLPSPAQLAEPEAVVAVYPSGQVVIGAGCTVGAVLDALAHAERVVRAIVLRPEQALEEHDHE